MDKAATSYIRTEPRFAFFNGVGAASLESPRSSLDWNDAADTVQYQLPDPSIAHNPFCLFAPERSLLIRDGIDQEMPTMQPVVRKHFEGVDAPEPRARRHFLSLDGNNWTFLAGHDLNADLGT